MTTPSAPDASAASASRTTRSLALDCEGPARRILGGGDSLRDPRARGLADRRRRLLRGGGVLFFLDMLDIAIGSSLAPQRADARIVWMKLLFCSV